MWVLLLFGALVSVGWADRSDPCADECQDTFGPMNVRAEVQEARINRLAGQIQALNDKIKKAITQVGNYKQRFRELDARANQLQGQSKCILFHSENTFCLVNV